MAVRVTLDINSVVRRVERAAELATEAAATQALKDSTRYVKKDSGVLEASGIRDSNLKKGKLIWITPYARKQYYLEGASKDVNPQASKMWAHKARAAHGTEWRRIVQGVIDSEV